MSVRDLREQRHTPQCQHPAHLPGEPDGYLAWSAWVEEKHKTHVQLQCSHCRLWLIWEPREDVPQ